MSDETCPVTLRGQEACTLPKGHIGYHSGNHGHPFGPWQGEDRIQPAADSTPGTSTTEPTCIQPDAAQRDAYGFGEGGSNG